MFKFNPKSCKKVKKPLYFITMRVYSFFLTPCALYTVSPLHIVMEYFDSKVDQQRTSENKCCMDLALNTPWDIRTVIGGTACVSR